MIGPASKRARGMRRFHPRSIGPYLAPQDRTHAASQPAIAHAHDAGDLRRQLALVERLGHIVRHAERADTSRDRRSWHPPSARSPAGRATLRSLARMRLIASLPSITGMCTSSSTRSNCFVVQAVERLLPVHGLDEFRRQLRREQFHDLTVHRIVVDQQDLDAAQALDHRLARQPGSIGSFDEDGARVITRLAMKVSVKVDPMPGSLSTETSPPMSCAQLRDRKAKPRAAEAPRDRSRRPA